MTVGKINIDFGVSSTSPLHLVVEDFSDWFYAEDLPSYVLITVPGSKKPKTKIKIKGTKFWNSPNTGATNSSNFFAIPNGYIGSYGSDEGK